MLTVASREPRNRNFGIIYAHEQMTVRYTGFVAYKVGPMRTERELVYPLCVNPQ